MTLLSLLVFGYEYGPGPNLDQALVAVHRLLDPELFPGDPFADSFRAFPSAYPAFVALLSRAVPLEPLHFTLYLILRVFLLLTALRLGDFLLRDRLAGLFAATLLALSPWATLRTFLGDDPLMKTSLYHTSAAAPFALAALSWFFQGRLRAALAAAAAALWLSPLVGLYLAAMLAAASVGRTGVRRAWLVYVALAVPWLFWRAGLPRPGGGWTPDFLPALRLWHPGHYFPGAWPASKWLAAAATLALLGACLVRVKPRAREGRAVLAALSAAPALWIFGALGAALSLPFVVSLQLFRSDALAVALGLVLAGGVLAELARSGRAERLFLAGFLALALTELGDPLLSLPAAVLLGLCALKAPWLRAGAAAFLVFLAGLLAGPLALSPKLAAAGLLLAGMTLPAGALRPGWAAALAALLALWPLAPYPLERLRLKTLSNDGARERDWAALQDWARERTPKQSRFLTPPYLNGFRTLSLRSPAVEWIELSAAHWSPGFEAGWLKRLEALGFDRDILAAAVEGRLLPSGEPADPRLVFERLAPARLKAISRRLGASYLVQESPGLLKWPVAYSNAGFTVYRVPGDK